MIDDGIVIGSYRVRPNHAAFKTLAVFLAIIGTSFVVGHVLFVHSPLSAADVEYPAVFKALLGVHVMAVSLAMYGLLLLHLSLLFDIEEAGR